MNLDDLHILLIEDDPGDARRLLVLLQEASAGHFHVEHVDRLDGALSAVGEKRFDAVLADLSFPGGTVSEALTRLRASAPKVPIVALATPDGETAAIQAMREGAQDYLVKGRSSGELLVRAVRYACERARAVEALERRDQHYRSLIENSLDLVSILSMDGTIRYASPSHERTLGYTVDELIGQNTFSFIHAEDLLRVRGAIQRVGANALEYRFRHKDGSWRILESFGRDLSQVAGVGGVVVNSRDVTDRKRLEDQLHHAQRIEALGRLAGGVAHDFNNLLMVIGGHSQMLLDAMLPGDPGREDLEQVVKAAERATDLTRQLLAFSRRQTVRPALLNLNVLVQQMDRMLRRVLGETIQLVTILGPDLHPVFADPGQLEQVILNLALNARDAMPQGGRLTLETSNSGGTAPDESHVTLCISDTGSGMDADVLPHVFEPFFTTKEHGTGLGLATSYGIVKQAGGEIQVTSQPGAGTTFRISLPIAPQNAEQQAPETEGSPLRGTETILLVEDEEGVRHVLETMLKRSGYSVLSSGSTSEAMAVAEGHAGNIDLLITDMVLPGMSGMSMADRLAVQRPGMRVLYVSGYGDPVSPGSEAAFLQKPFSTSELAVKIREVLQGAP